MAINTVTEACTRAREELIKMNGVFGVVMLQIESANLLDNYPKNNGKSTWKVVCSFFDSISGTNRVKREVFLDKETGECIDYNGFHK